MTSTNKNSPFFSIITPVYNRKDCMKNAIQSITTQDFDSWEYIIVDDGSVDGTAEIVDKEAATDERIKVFHQPHNQGVSAARNRGIENARGKYLLFLDSDDEFKRGAFSFLVDVLNKDSNVDTIIFPIPRLEEGISINVQPVLGADYTLSYNEIRTRLLQGLLGICPHEENHIFRPMVINKCIRREIFSKNNILFDTKKITWEDAEVNIKALAQSKKTFVTETALMIGRTSDVNDHLSMKYYPDGAKNLLSQYKWAIDTFGQEFDFENEYALNWYFNHLQTWLWRILSKDKNRRRLVLEVLRDPAYIRLSKLRTPNGIFEKAIRFCVVKKLPYFGYLFYVLQNFLNHGETF